MVSERRRHARALFAPLGPTYDRVGAVLSFGQDPRWRRFLVSRLPSGGGRVLDVATGTGLVAAALLERGFEVTGLDQSPDMLDLARGVSAVASSSSRLRRRPALSRRVLRPPHVHLPAPLCRRSRRDDARARARRSTRRDDRDARVRPSSRNLETALGRLGRRRPSTRGPGDLARLARGRALPRAVDPPVPRGVPGAGARGALARRRDRGRPAPPPQPGRRESSSGGRGCRLATGPLTPRERPRSTRFGPAGGVTT